MLGLNVASIASRSSVVDTVTLVGLHSLLKASINPYSRPISVGYSLANPFSLWHRPPANLCPYTTLSNNHAVLSHGQVGTDSRIASSTAWSDARFRPSNINCVPSCDYNCRMSVDVHNCCPFTIIYEVLHCPYH